MLSVLFDSIWIVSIIYNSDLKIKYQDLPFPVVQSGVLSLNHEIIQENDKEDKKSVQKTQKIKYQINNL